MSCRPLPDAVRPLAAGTAGPAPAEAVEAATEVVDPGPNGAMGGGTGAMACPVGGTRATGGTVAMTKRKPLVEEWEGGVKSAGFRGTVGGTYATGGPASAAPTTLSGVELKICARFDAHR